MKALTLQQPWAWAIFHGQKTIENRTWPTHHRGPLLIHAGKSRERLGDFGPGEPPADRLVFGALLGVVQLVRCCRLDQVAGQPFAEGPYCWLLSDPQPFARPIPWRGAQGLFDVPDEIITELMNGAPGSDATRQLLFGQEA